MVWVVHTDMSSTYTQNISPRPLRHQPPMELSAWPYKHSVIPKQEPMDYEERSDSGIDFQTSSPGSDHSDNIRYSSPSIPSPIHHPYYPMAATLAMMQYSGVPIPFHNEHNRLTPPSSESMVSPKNLQNVTQTTSSIEDKSEVSNIPQTTLTPCTSPEENNGQSFSNSVGIDALKQLQNAMERTDFLPPSISPNSSENSRECSNTSDMDTENCQEQLINGVPINVPKVNSHGKIKQFKCKHCKFVAITKTEFWRHSRIHIKEEKQLRCTYCEFVTEYKHHFEYHMNNHTGAKPFKCSQCTYTCVNKSMLNSHFKSHSEVYQYRCNDCKYVTKYVHSLKIHLRKYEHKPAVVLNPDGTPNPLPVIDVYGTRRGPKIKFQKPRTVQENLPQREASGSFPFNPLLFNAQQMQFPFPPFVGGFPGVMPNPFLLANFETLINKRQELPNENTPRDNQDDPRENQDSSHTEENHGDQSQEIQSEVEVLDLSKHNKQPAQKNRRKGRAFKLTPGHDNDSDDEFTTMFNNVEVVENVPAETSTREESSSESEEHLHNNKDENCCKFCIIDFGDPVLYSMHMGYHNLQNPFTCNMCGEVCSDKFAFFVHIARTPHSEKTV